MRSEVDRYLGWPGQAISYKVGERVWLDARADARQRHGSDFDLKAFHSLRARPRQHGPRPAARRAREVLNACASSSTGPARSAVSSARSCIATATRPVLVARGAHHDAIAAAGLRFRSPDEDIVVPVPVVGDAERDRVPPR